MRKLELPLLEVKGAPHELGVAQGEALRAPIEGFVAQRFAALAGYAEERGQGDDREALLEIGREAMEIHEAWDPDGVEEHRGIARGAGLDPVTLYTVTNMTDLRDALLLSAPSGVPHVRVGAAEGCSSLLVPASMTRDGAALVGQTWDLNPPDVEFVVAIRRAPRQGPRTWSVTCAGCLTLVGHNEAGLAVGTTNIKTFGSRPGVGYLGVLHRAIRAEDSAEASRLVETAPVGAAHTYWVADAETQVEWERSAHGAFPRDTSAGPIWRTNHCLAEPNRALEGEVPSDSSRARFARLGALLAHPGQTVESLKALFADRSDGVCSINRYAEDGQGTATNSVYIARPGERRAWACRGSADRGVWVELGF